MRCVVATVLFSAVLGGARAQAPDTYRVRIETTQGSFVLEATRALAPHGADRFYHLVENRLLRRLAILSGHRDASPSLGLRATLRRRRSGATPRSRRDPDLHRYRRHDAAGR